MQSSWRVTYAPGAWTVLVGPAVLVALDPAAAAPDLVSGLWSDVATATPAAALVRRLAGVDRAQLADLLVLFLEQGGVRALLRGDVTVRAAGGEVLARGADVLTWQEVRLADQPRLELDLGGAESFEDALPVVAGAVRAGRVRLAAGATEEPSTAPIEVGWVSSLPPDQDDPGPSTEPIPAPAPAPVEASPRPAEPSSPSEVEAMEQADTEQLHLPPPAVARLRAPDGSTVDLDRPVLIGRAPSDVGYEDVRPHLLTVPSPGGDISRTHVLVAPDEDGILVTDLRSTNGTTVVLPGPGVERVALPSGHRLTVGVGAVLELGDDVAILIDTTA